MRVNFPGNCTSEGSKWSYTTKLAELLRVYHNENCAGMTAQEAVVWRSQNFNAKMHTIMVERNEQISISCIDNYWNATVDNVDVGVITYPVELDQDNEGSVASFLFGLECELKDNGRNEEDVDYKAVHKAIGKVKGDAKKGLFWEPQLGDVR